MAYDKESATSEAAPPPTAARQTPASVAGETGSLSSLVRGAQGGFTPQTEGEKRRARDRLLAAAAKLDRYLSGGGANGAAWKRYLKWDEMQRQLAPGGAGDLAVLEQVYECYVADHAGLERPIWRDVALALRNYIDVSISLAEPQPEQAFQEELTRLADSLGSFEKSGDSEAIERAGLSLGWLARRRLAAPLLKAIRQRLSHPNLYVDISDDLVAAGSRRLIDETAPVSDMILGTAIRGQGRTVGHVSVRLTPAGDRALLETTLEATNDARTVGSNGPARIGSTSRTRLVGRQQLAIDELGFHPLPANAWASAQSCIHSVWSARHGLVGRIVRKAALKRIPQQKRQSERIAARHAEQRLVRRLNEEVDRQVRISNASYLEKVRNPLVRLGQLPRQIEFSTTADQLRFVVLHDGPDRLAAPSPPPELSVAGDLTVRFHESLPNNFAHGLLAGRTLTRDQFEQLAKRYLNRVPEELDSDPLHRDWSITFPSFNPITLRIDRQAATITVRGRKFSSDGQPFNDAMNVTARYRLENQEGAIKAVRQGELEIFPPGFIPNSGQRLPFRLAGIRNLLKHRFEKIFPPEYVSPGLFLPGQLQRVGRLELVNLESGGGWMLLGWRPAPEKPRLVQRAEP